jgi:anti-sigma regulatory factor (Ser/Thr protein kinase)
MGTENSLTVPGRYREIRRLCKFVGKGAQRAGFDEDSIFQIELACDEACTNIIEHTYGGEDEGSITVSWQIEKRRFVVIIKDHGGRFNPERIPPPPMPPEPASTNNEFDLQVGGLGVYFMRQLMDTVDFSYKAGTGNVLKMEKALPGEEEG